MKLTHILSLALICTALAGCEELVNPRREALESLTSHAVLPLLEDFEQKSEALAESAQALCDFPEADRLEAARDAWKAARAPWKQSEVLSFGPHTLSPWRLAPQIDFWPTRVDDIEAVLNGEVALTGDEALSEVGASGRGFSAVEYLLFASDEPSAFGEGERRCDYLIAASADLHARARELHEAWRDEFAAELTDQAGEHYANLDEAFGELVNNLAFTVEVVRDDKLGRPLGRKTDDVPQPELVESRFSQRSIADSIDVLRGIESIFEGSYGDAQGKGLLFVLHERHRDLDGQLALHMDNAKDALEAIDAPLDAAVVDDPEAVAAAMAALRKLLVFFQVDVAQALGVTVTFGGADGD